MRGIKLIEGFLKCVNQPVKISAKQHLFYLNKYFKRHPYGFARKIKLYFDAGYYFFYLL